MLYEAADAGYVDPKKVEDILRVSREQSTTAAMDEGNNCRPVVPTI